MKKFGLLILLLWSCLTSAIWSQETMRVTFQGAENLKYTEKANLRIRENGRYLGYLYKESRAFFDLHDVTTLSVGGSEYAYRGNVYILEDQKRDSRQAKRIDDQYEILLHATDRGEYRTDNSYPYPRTRGLPVLLSGEYSDGDTWREYGSQVIVAREGSPATEVKFYCEYRYKGEGTYLERPVYVITAQYATRYSRGQDPDGDPEVAEASGKHLLTIYVDMRGEGWMFIRDQVDEQYRFIDGSTREIEGFYLTWYEGASARNIDEDVESLETELAKDGVQDITVAETGEGVSISLQKIHFQPDRAEVLPNEVERLDKVAEVLKTTGDGTIKVVGHTADVGKPEGQYQLSVQRAIAIIEQMVQRGLAAERFIYEGRGGSEPVETNDTEEGRAANRRVEFIILKE